MSATKVLVVDDDPISIQAVLECLTQAGYQVFTRERALGTARWVAAEKPDFVILDVWMPALDGAELALLMHRNRQTAESAVILWSSMDKDELAKLATQSGAVGYIHKTSNRKHFLGQFERIVAQQRRKGARK